MWFDICWLRQELKESQSSFVCPYNQTCLKLSLPSSSSWPLTCSCSLSALCLCPLLGAIKSFSALRACFQGQTEPKIFRLVGIITWVVVTRTQQRLHLHHLVWAIIYQTQVPHLLQCYSGPSFAHDGNINTSGKKSRQNISGTGYYITLLSMTEY